VANVRRATAITALFNRLTFNDAEQVRALFSELVSLITTGRPLEPSQRRAATLGRPIAIEKNVWIAE
jgi:hypothetical protein